MAEIVLISDRRLLPIESMWEIVAAGAKEGLTALMIREKDLPGRPLLAIVREALARCRPHGVRVIVNDRIDVALAAGADGVHLGVAAIPVEDARRIAAGRLRIGASTHSIAELRAAERGGADYATFGPVFATASKAAYGPPIGIAALREAVLAARIPVLALGGVTPERAGLVMGTGAAGVAAISALLLAAEPAAAVRALAAGLGAAKDPP